MANYFTQKGLEKLKEELLRLKNTERRAVAQDIKKAAAFGDLSENAAYKDAKERKAFVEGRILELEKMLVNAKILENKSSNKVEVGSKVCLALDGQKNNFTIVYPAEANMAKGFLSCDSPIGQAILGCSIGQEIAVKTPAGKVKCKILKVG